jgi:hypothetical protein
LNKESIAFQLKIVKFFFVIVGILLTILILEPIETIYNVTATTERIEMKNIQGMLSRIVFEDVEVYDLGKDQLISNKFKGSIEIKDSSNIRIDRVSKGYAVLSINSSTKSCADIYPINEETISSSNEIEIIIKDIAQKGESGITTIIPITGEVNLGRAIDIEVPGEKTSLLLEGKVSMTGRTKLFSERFEAASIRELLLGDQLVFDKVKSNVSGFVLINENAGLKVAYRLIADRARILKPGLNDSQSGNVIRIDSFDRLVNSKIFQSISILFGGILFISSFGSFIMRYVKFKY